MKKCLCLLLGICLFMSFCSCSQEIPKDLSGIALKGGFDKSSEHGGYREFLPEKLGFGEAVGEPENKRKSNHANALNKNWFLKINRLSGCLTAYTYDTGGDYTVPVKSMACICPRDKIPTGKFDIYEKYSWCDFINGSRGVYCSKISGDILLYAMPSFQSSLDMLLAEEYGRLHGLIRLAPEDAKWIFENCDAGTKVVIYDDTDPGPLGMPKNTLIPETGGNYPAQTGSEIPPDGLPVLISEGPLRAELGDRINFLKGITATDAQGADISDRVRWKTNSEITAAGNYIVLYFVTGSNGNTVMLRRVLEIYERGELFLYEGEIARTVVQASADRYHTMGISVAVIENGRVVDTIANGYAVYKTREMTVDTKIRIASISKIVVSLAAAKLMDEGMIDPHEDISTYWGANIRNPRFPHTPITIRDILCHTSSLRSNDEDYRLGVDRTLRQLTAGQVFLYCEPGLVSSYMYNNYAFGVLGVTLELVCGEVLDDYLRKNIFEEIGIEASFSTATLKKEELASLYNADWQCTRSVDYISTRPIYTELGYYIWYYAGNLTVSAGDLAKLVTVLINDGKYEDRQILSPESVAWLEEPQFTTEDEIGLEFDQCCPLRYRRGMYGREDLYYHSGAAFGVFSLICYDPVSRDGVVVITTGATTGYDEYGVTSVCGDIADTILRSLEH
jgi:CubicO group peptidase (beta-lactamase class C family)